MTGEWRRLHNDHDVYWSPNIIRVIKLRRMRWAGHVAGVGDRRGAYRVWWGDLRKRDHLEDPVIDGGNVEIHFQYLGWWHGLD